MKKTIIALLALAGAAVGAETIEFSPFKDAATSLFGSWSGAGDVTSANDTYTPPYNWQGSIATYTLKNSITLANPGDIFNFSYNYTQGNGNNVLTVSLVGESNVLVTGKGRFSWKAGAQAVYGAHGNSEGFALEQTNNNKIKVMSSDSDDNISSGAPQNETVTLTGAIAWNEERELFMLSFSSSSTNASPGSLSVELGKTFDVSKIILSSSGPATVNVNNVDVDNKASLAALKISATNIPEPTTATLSLLALAGLVARRRRASR
ncbi:MAG: PEP-CTERM sorting domain-containing protein [Akkermansia sp.]|nr:PEP-CTERM sorting domain-containing protein [Akkermansia sp.]